MWEYISDTLSTQPSRGADKLTFRVRFFPLIKNLLYIGCIATGLMMLMFYPFVEHALTYDYATAYSAYSGDLNFPKRILLSVMQGGFSIYSIFFIGVTIGLISKKFRRLTIFLSVWAAIPIILISRIQFMGMQHYYPMLRPFCIIVVVAILAGLRYSKILGGVLIFLLALNWVQVYTDILPTNASLEKYRPQIRHDVDAVKNLVGEINSLANGRTVYFLTSSGLYNISTFQSVYLPETLDAIANLIYPAELDLRDGFNTEFFDAGIVIVPTPEQIHQKVAKDQSVVIKLGELVKSAPLSRHFKKIADYDLKPQDNPSNPDYVVNFAVYEKISPFDEEDITFVENVFVELYPNYPELFKNRFEKYKAEHFDGRGN